MSKFTFAHLIGRKAKATEEDDEKTRKAKGRRAEDDDEEENAENDDPESEDQDDEKENGKKGKKAKKAEGDDEDPDAEEEDAEGDDEDAEDDDDDKDVKKGRRAEQKRCARIFGSKAAAGRPDMAAHLAFNTRMSSSEAISTLKAMGAVQPTTTQRASLDSRMREEQQVRVGPDAQAPVSGSANALVQQMTNLYNTNKGAK